MPEHWLNYLRRISTVEYTQIKHQIHVIQSLLITFDHRFISGKKIILLLLLISIVKPKPDIRIHRDIQHVTHKCARADIRQPRYEKRQYKFPILDKKC